MSKCISILGSTGSIGRQTLEVAECLGISVAALTMNSSIDLAEEQARKFRPRLLAVANEKAAADLKVRLADTAVRVASGKNAILEAASQEDADTVVTAMVGIAGLEPTLAAIHAGKRIALANKETLVCAGELVMAEAKRCNAEIVPVDSEHSAIFQCLEGNQKREVKRLILTASGGPFCGYDRQALSLVTREQALRHPNWAMGAKITVDSATLMNKGLEFIEAMRLYDIPPERISIAVHRESIIHSMVEYCDGAILAQLGAPDMRVPIQYALTWPERVPGPAKTLDLFSCPPLTFSQADVETFRCLKLALECARIGGTSTAILNGANEAAVSLFLNERITLTRIDELVNSALERVEVVQNPRLEDILKADMDARRVVMDSI